MSRSPLNPPSTAAMYRGLIPLGILMTAVAVAAQGGKETAAPGGGPDGSVLPPAPGQSAPTAPAPAVGPKAAAPAAEPGARPAAERRARLEITVLRAGAAPYPWSEPGRLVKSFITNSP